MTWQDSLFLEGVDTCFLPFAVYPIRVRTAWGGRLLDLFFSLRKAAQMQG